MGKYQIHFLDKTFKLTIVNLLAHTPCAIHPHLFRDNEDMR